MYYYYAKNRKKINPDNINFISNLANSFSPVTEWPGDIFTTEIENDIFEQESGAIKVTKQEAQIIVNRSLRNKVYDAPNGELGNEDYRGLPITITLP